MKVCAITATAGRHYCIERSVRFFLEQDYENCIQLIYQNSNTEQRLDPNIPGDKIILVNRNIYSQTQKRYTTLGQIYNDALLYVPEDTDIICFMDDDDWFLRNHISEGVKGLIRGGKTAYKPSFSYLIDSNRVIHKVQNTLEPSIFAYSSHIKMCGFRDSTSDQHLQWVDNLVYNGKIFVDPNGPSTLCYVWGGDKKVGTFKTSGNFGHPDNFHNYHMNSVDHGDQIITPLPVEELNEIYDLFK